MDFNEDEDLLISSQAPDGISREQARRDALKREIKAKTGKEAKKGKGLNELKEELKGKEEKPIVTPLVPANAPKTKTIKEMEDDKLVSAQDKPTSDTMIERQAEEQSVSDEEVQSEPG